MASQLNSSTAPKPSRRLIAVHLLQTTGTFVVLGSILFIAAGRLAWREAWIFIIVYYLIGLATAAWMLRANPELVQERARPGKNVKSWDNLLVGINLVLSLGLFAVIGVDAGRLDGSDMPVWLQIIGLLGFIPAFGLPLWAARTNAFLSSRVRIQEERDHRVVTEGPYGYIRHPMYAGMICFNLSLPLLFGSWWGVAVGLVINGLICARTALEDKTLQAELPGYREYSRQVRYRLLPGVW